MKSSRRKFLQASLASPLAVAIGGRSGFAFGPYALLTPNGGQDQFQNPQIIRYDSACFTLRNRDTFIHSACFHYCRCPRELWQDRLTKFKQAGFNTIETYVFWNYHEPVEGRVNLDEFEDFVKLVGSMGFYMIARPGPYVCAEWDAGGFPHWVIAQQFPLRSADPKSIQTSQHWYNAVLPVIERHTITNGGPIIILQIENEYDYWGQVPSPEKIQYLTALAQMVWNAGIDIPLITNWCREARDNSNPVMARITDTADFYPRWDIVKGTVGRIGALRKAESSSPLGVTELQGGWFSQFGGKLSVDQPGVDGAQLNMLTKTMIEQGVTFFSFYMGFGGTNFDWAGKNLTTTYDYAAPIREPGGLWEKYYAARGIGESLKQYGPLLARSQTVDGSQSTNPAVSVTERANGTSGFLFVRENANQQQQFKLTFPDPASPSHRLITVPREGQLTIGPREMKMLPLQVPLPGAQLRYTTAEVLGSGLNEDRAFLLLYDERHRIAEIAVSTSSQPQVEGDTAYQYWDSDYETVVLGVNLETTENMWLVNGNLQIIVVPGVRGLRTWIADFPSTVLPNAETKDKVQVPFITTCAMMADSGSSRGHAWAELDYIPGTHHLTTLWSSQPDRCLVDGSTAQAAYDEHWRTTRMVIETPPLPVQPQDLTQTQAEMWVEKFDLNTGDWLTSPAQALELMGEIPYGYVKYHAEFEAASTSQMAFSTFADDGKQVFINGKNVKEASNNKPQVQFDASSYLQSGANTLEIAYELFGSPNFGPKMAELKGLEFARVWSDPSKVVTIEPWKIQRVPAAMRGRAIDPEFSVGGWQAASLGSFAPDTNIISAFCWIRSKFTLAKPAENWSIMWNAAIEADRDALLYLNGRFVGRYVTQGPQTQFYLPEPWLQWGASNTLTVVLAYTDQPQHIKTLRIAPYSEFATHRTRVEFHWR
ncbi:MAG TPA: beta-galactosidase [Terriglobia bacterium]|nr:beta-galactosidase [Terriglobia bacterium]